MKRILLLALSVLVLVTTQAPAQEEQRGFRQEELDQMLAPIALYPDSLLTQILIASTYPLEVIEAARWSKANPQLRGQAAVEAVKDKEWDESVKSLTAFPQVLAQMDEKLDWTKRLGDAFVAQEPQVMETVQELRRRAYDAGNLRSNENTVVTRDDRVIVVEQAKPEVVYVPYYDPWIAYGSWWWPAYPPVYWRPWPGYYAYPGFSAVFWWGAPVVVGGGFYHAKAHWAHGHGHPQHHVTVVNKTNVVVNKPGQHGHAAPPAEKKWTHDPVHRRKVGYQHQPRQPRGQPSPARQMQLREQAERGHPMPGANGWSRPQPRAETPRPQPRVEAPRPQPRAETPRPQPRVEAPRAQPRVEAPRPQPRVEAPRPQPRVEAPRPQPRAEMPRFQPQPRMEQQRPQPQMRAEPPRQHFQQQRPQGGGGMRENFRRQG